MKSIGCISKTSSYLIRPHHAFCFRLSVPPDLQPIIGEKELRYSLETCYRDEAQSKAKALSEKVHQLFAGLRKFKEKGMTQELNQYQIKRFM